MERSRSPAAPVLAAAIALLVLAGVWAWWAAKEGGYFGPVHYPGIVVLCAGFVLVSSRTAWGTRLAISGPAKVALAALLALAAWSALSALWSPAPDVAVADAQKIAGYALAFGLGLWLARLVAPRFELALVPLAFAGLFAGLVTAAVLLTGDGSDFGRYIDDGTLQYPIGYRNANAAFFLVAMWAAVALAASHKLDWRVRALALGAATISLQVAALSQSRGSTLAIAASAVVFLCVSRERARGVAWLGLAVLPALIVIPAVTDLYDTSTLDSYEGVTELRTAGRALLLGGGIAVLIGAAAALIGRRRPVSAANSRRADRVVAIAAVVLALVGAGGFVAATGDPADWFSDRADEFLNQGTPGSEGRSRFGVNAGTERDDLWRVAIDEFEDEPLLGAGGGGFQYAYLIRRSDDGIESVRDAHSVEIEMLSELGLPGLLLFVVAIGAAAVGAFRARIAGVAAAALSTAALTAGTYWLVHASLDWFWTYPAVTAPIFALLGSACAAGARAGDGGAPTPWRRVAAAGAIVLALSVIPPYLAERYVEAAYDGFRSDPVRAQEDLDRARDLNALSIEPLLAEGGIAIARGEREQAIAAFEEAAEERPEEWATHYFLAQLNRNSPAVARAELDRAFALNPLSVDLIQLEERLDLDE